MNELKEIISRYWGYTEFRPGQEAIMSAVLNQQDVVALLPTGGGKSLCFQAPALAMDGLCIVISPLVALMKDQVDRLKSMGIKAISLSGGLSSNDLGRLLDNVRFGNYQFLYLSPERLQQELVQQCILQLKPSLFAIDEAHCISQWGNDFRPAYKLVNWLRESHPIVPMLALTATATEEVLADTISLLQLRTPYVHKNSFLRSNIAYHVLWQQDKIKGLKRLLSNEEGSSIVYVRSRKMAERVSAQLNHLGMSTTFFHGGLTSEEKHDRLSLWKDQEALVMVATSAFGMGIDHDDVRQVIHIQLPENLESYFQETGRAGRDGEAARTSLLVDEADFGIAQHQFVDAQPNIQQLKDLLKNLYNFFQISYGEGEFTEHAFEFGRFCERYGWNAQLAYNGLQTMDRLGVLRLSKAFGRKSKLTFLVTSDELLTEFEKNTSFSLIGGTILRMYGGVFNTAVAVRLEDVARKLNIEVDRVIPTLKQMESLNLVELELQHTDASVTFLIPREDDKTINRFRREIEWGLKRKKEQLQAVFEYVRDDRQCKQHYLLSYFGEEGSPPCGICSYCEGSSKGGSSGALEELAVQITTFLENGPAEADGISDFCGVSDHELTAALKVLLDAKKISVNLRNQYCLK